MLARDHRDQPFIGSDEGILVGAIDQTFALHSLSIYGVAGIAPPTQILLTDWARVGAGV